MSHCDNFHLLVWKQSAATTLIMSRLRCKMWSCPYCAKKNREMWSSFLKKKLPRVSVDWWFVTITAHERSHAAKNTLSNLRHGIDVLMKRVRRVWKDVSYVRVYEKHVSGAFHAHFIMAGLSGRVERRVAKNHVVFYRPVEAKEKHTWLTETWFKKNARAVGLGYMVKCTSVYGHHRAVWYVCKYLTKEAQAFAEKGLRRIQTSVRIGSPKAPGEGGWQVAGHVWKSDLPVNGRLVDLNLKLVVEDNYWTTNEVYPPDQAS